MTLRLLLNDYVPENCLMTSLQLIDDPLSTDCVINENLRTTSFTTEKLSNVFTLNDETAKSGENHRLTYGCPQPTKIS